MQIFICMIMDLKESQSVFIYMTRGVHFTGVGVSTF